MSEMDRSVIFTCLLQDEDFKRLEMHEGSAVVTTVTEAWQASTETDMFLFVERWLEDNPIGARV